LIFEEVVIKTSSTVSLKSNRECLHLLHTTKDICSLLETEASRHEIGYEGVQEVDEIKYEKVDY